MNRILTLYQNILFLISFTVCYSCSATEEIDNLNVDEPTYPESGGKVFNAVVDKNGNGDYKTIQDAINAVPANMTKPYLIFIANGTYEECLYINSQKTFIHLIGESCNDVKVQFALNRVNDEKNSEAWAYSIYNLNSPLRKAGYTDAQNAVVIIDGNDIYMENISIINLYGALGSRYDGGLGCNGQAEALISRQDRLALNNCKLVSYQDTWWTRCRGGEAVYRTYVNNSWIEGRTDYVWGCGDLLIENSIFYNTDHGSIITASRSNATDVWGYVIKDCTISGEKGITSTSFGRSQSTTAKATWINTQMKMDIIDTHWKWGGQIPKRFAEYNTIDINGRLISEPKLISSGYDFFHSSVLDKNEVIKYNYENIIAADGWNPKLYMEAPIIVSKVSLKGNVLSWEGVEGALGYIVFCDGRYVGQTTAMSMTLNDVFKSSLSVRAVGKYGSLSK